MKLENMEPFNEIFYKNCYYCALLSTITYFKKSVLPITLNEVDIFGKDADTEYFIEHKTIFIKPLPQALREYLGIAQKEIFSVQNIIEELKAAITEQTPVIIKVDRYYQSVVKKFYKKMHNHHAFLLYGFDDDEKMFDALDDNYMGGSNLFVKCKMSYSDISAAHKGFVEHYQQKLNTSVLYKLSLIPGTFGNYNLKTLRALFFEYLLEQKDKLYESLAHLGNFNLFFQDLILKEKQFMQQVMPIETMIWKILMTKNAEKYKMEWATGNSKEVMDVLNNIVKIWSIIRMLLLKLNVSEYSAELVQSIAAYFKKVSTLEKEYLDKLYLAIPSLII